jgi:hypothetical protein
LVLGAGLSSNRASVVDRETGYCTSMSTTDPTRQRPKPNKEQEVPDYDEDLGDDDDEEREDNGEGD